MTNDIFKDVDGHIIGLLKGVRRQLLCLDPDLLELSYLGG
jgi:hypothetical protein